MAKAKPKKYVVVLAHADGWGALSANKVVRHLHEHYPDVGIHLVVSKATKGKDGRPLTKLDDLRAARDLKETNLLDYFARVDAMYEADGDTKPMAKLDSSPTAAQTLAEYEQQGYQLVSGQLGAHGLIEMEGADGTVTFRGYDVPRDESEGQYTFNQLATRYCADQTVHYTNQGGKPGGAEVEAVVRRLETDYGHGPEVLLSVDTMAILPESLLRIPTEDEASMIGHYHCFSAHPGPLDTIKIEGMQATLRSLANQILYDAGGNPLPASHPFGMGMAHLKGTLFLQHPELDKGPPVHSVLSVIYPGVSAYQARNDVYHQLTDEMIERLPVLLDPAGREVLVREATDAKQKLDLLPHKKIPALEAEQFARWQSQCGPVPDDSAPYGIGIVQNEIVNPFYFRGQMRRFFPGTEAEFSHMFEEVYAHTLQEIDDQRREYLAPVLRAWSGEPGSTYTKLDPKTFEPVFTLTNPPRDTPRGK